MLFVKKIARNYRGGSNARVFTNRDEQKTS